MSDKKLRTDDLLVERGLAESRSRARALILAGQVRSGTQVIDKAGHMLAPEAELEVVRPLRFVSRGGEKLDHALRAFDLEVADYTCADFGASTGGFTDVLLQRGAAKVYSIDVGYGQLDYRLRSDDRVVVIDRTNARYLERLPDPIDLVTIDVSFISLSLVLPAAKRVLKPDGRVVALVKPQFEAGKNRVGRGGVVRDPSIHRQVLEAVIDAASALDLRLRELTPSPLKGPAGNVEFLGLFDQSDAAGRDKDSLIDAAMASARSVGHER
jgi:23S rRNA (cytidine1920-2'-O)/16S rRNA (cytidine1409-2'-O)-methyltransferase